MLRLFAFILFLYCLAGDPLMAQQPVASKTFAVVIGISAYENKALPLLKYADIDAGIFAGYLQSKAGGNLPDSQLKILINQDATIAAVYDALDWVREKCSRNDVAYIYFSGHGDVETNEAGATGYLLAYNTPPNNYANNAVSIKDLNAAANALSTQNKAKVVLITDACHSGKLAGDFFKGKQLASGQLKLILNNEARLAACASDEEAAEGPDWGGGRGAFSYYLLDGLNGMADVESDGVIKLKEISAYLDSAFKNDKILRAEQRKQHPVVDGNPGFSIAVVDRPTLTGVKLQADKKTAVLPDGLAAFKKAAPTLMDNFFTGAAKQPLESFVDFRQCLPLANDQIPQIILEACVRYQQLRKQEQDSVNGLGYDMVINDFMRPDSLQLLMAQLSKGGKIISQFNEKLVQLIHAMGQQMVNAYLTGDLAELEKRQYYYAGNRQYNRFLHMLDVALRLVPGDHSLIRLLTVHKAYISGLIDRLNIATASARQTDSLVKTAFRHQQSAIQLEPYGAYIHNEIGNLFLRLKKLDSAAYHYKMASVLAPTWAIPWSNIMRLNLAQKQTAAALQALRKADSLQPNLAYVMVNAGLVMEEKKDWLSAAYFYKKAIAQNNVHYLPYERLGFVYLHTGRYNLADSFFYEAETRKADFAINEKYFEMGIELGGNPLSDDEFVPDTSAVSKMPLNKNVQPFVNLANALAMLQFPPEQLGKGFRPPNEDKGLAMLTLALQQMPGIPLAQHYLGRAFWGRNYDWQKTEQALQLAVQQYSPDNELEQQLRNALYNGKPRGDTNLLEKLMQFKYEPLEDHYLLGNLYEQHGLIDDALNQFKIITTEENQRLLEQAGYQGFPEKGYPSGRAIPQNEEAIKLMESLINKYDRPSLQAGYLLASRLYENQGDWLQAEKALTNQLSITRLAGYTREAAIAAKRNGTWQLLTGSEINYYWLEVNRQIESSLYNFYQRMIAKFPRESEWQEKAGLFLHDRLALAFSRLPISQYTIFYQSMSKYSYPWMNGEKDDMEIEIRLLMPGTGLPLTIALQRYDPLAQSLEWLQQSVALSGDEKPANTVQEAIADLQAWTGKADEAIETYQSLLTEEPANISLKNKVIGYMEANNNLPGAYLLMDSLYQQNNLRQQQWPALAQCHLLSSKFGEAEAILNAAEKPGKRDSATIATLKATMYWLQGKSMQALVYLKDSTPVNIPATLDEDAVDDTLLYQQTRLYSIARMYALLKKEDKAATTLKAALNKGFPFKYVLSNDAVWAGLRKQQKWRELIDGYNFMEYAAGDQPVMYSFLTYIIPVLKK